MWDSCHDGTVGPVAAAARSLPLTPAIHCLPGLLSTQVGADVIGCADAELLKRSQSVARWWTDLVLGMLRR